MSMSRSIVMLLILSGCYAKERDDALATVKSLQDEVAHHKEDLATCEANLKAERSTPESRLGHAAMDAKKAWDDPLLLRLSDTDLSNLEKEYPNTFVGPVARKARVDVEARLEELASQKQAAEAGQVAAQKEAQNAAFKECQKHCEQPFMELPNCTGGWDVCRDQCILMRCMLHNNESRGVPIH